MSDQLTHLNAQGEAHMVDVADKAVTTRVATAETFVSMLPETLAMIVEGRHKKGDVFATCRIAGIMAAKKCAELIPLCHSLNLSSVAVELEPLRDGELCGVRIRSTCKLDAKTGVEILISHGKADDIDGQGKPAPKGLAQIATQREFAQQTKHRQRHGTGKQAQQAETGGLHMASANRHPAKNGVRGKGHHGEGDKQKQTHVTLLSRPQMSRQ